MGIFTQYIYVYILARIHNISRERERVSNSLYMQKMHCTRSTPIGINKVSISVDKRFYI